MFIKANSCPICAAPWEKTQDICSACGSVAELYFENPLPARHEVNEEKIERIIQRIRHYLVEHDNHGLAHYTLGLCYVNLGLLVEGLREIERARQLMPEKVHIAYEAVVVAVKQGDTSDKVLNQIDQVIGSKADFKEALFLKGVVLRKRGLVIEAARLWQAALELDNNYMPARQALQSFVNENKALLQNLTLADSIDKLAISKEVLTYIKLISSNGPGEPPPLGETSTKVLEAVLPQRAKAMRKMHALELERYEERQRRRRAAIAELEEDVISLSELVIVAAEAREAERGSQRPLTTEERSRILDRVIGEYQRQGYSLIFRTETTAQLSKKRQFSCCLAFFLVL